MPAPLSRPSSDPHEAGLPARRLAWDVLGEVLRRRAPLDDTFDELKEPFDLPARDEALARAIVGVALRRLGTLRHVMAERLAKGLPTDQRLFTLLAIGAAQVLFLDVADHAAVDTTVRLAQSERRLKPFAGLANAVLRRLVRERESCLADPDPWRDTPDWLQARWIAHYGHDRARAIALAHRLQAPVDLTVRTDPEAWTERLAGRLLSTGTVRLSDRTPIPELPGYREGAWWVQDAAAALPARLVAARPGERIADLCAAPGGKTAQLAAAGSAVLAVDRAAKRLDRLRQNMARLGLAVDARTADVLEFEETGFDAVLLDAPCSATGTLRRHPDVAWTKRPDDVAKLAELQRRLLDKAAELVRPGGRLVYCVCSLEPEEGERQAEAFLARRPDYERRPVEPQEIGGLASLIDAHGDLRTLPFRQVLAGDEGPGPEPLSGLDGFFAARFVRRTA